MEPFSLYNPRPIPSCLLFISHSLSPSLSLSHWFIRSLSLSLRFCLRFDCCRWQCINQEDDCTHQRRCIEWKRGGEGVRGVSGAVSRGGSGEGLGATRSVPLHPARPVQPRCIVREDPWLESRPCHAQATFSRLFSISLSGHCVYPWIPSLAGFFFLSLSLFGWWLFVFYVARERASVWAPM